MQAISDKRATIKRFKNMSFVPYNLIGALENTENNCYIDEATESRAWILGVSRYRQTN